MAINAISNTFLQGYSWVTNDNSSLFLQAVRTDDIVNAEFYLKKGVDVNAKTLMEKTVLMIAVNNGNKDMVKLLLDNRADVDVKTPSHFTALSFAVKKNNIPLVKLLLEHGANADALSVDGYFCNKNVLIEAVNKGNKNIVELLLKYKATVDRTDASNTTALNLAVQKSDKDIAKLLLDYGAFIEENALILAIKNSDKDMVELLLKYKIKVNVVDKETGNSALAIAVEKEDKDIANPFLDSFNKSEEEHLLYDKQEGNNILRRRQIRALKKNLENK